MIEIKDCQEQLNRLYTKTFGGDSKNERVQENPADYDTRDYIASPNAKAPPLKVDELHRFKKFGKTWKHDRQESFPSMSEYDYSLVSYALKDAWDIQEMIDLIIEFRFRYGNEEERKKALDLKYLLRTIYSVRDRDLELKTFEVETVEQFGVGKDATFKIGIKDGPTISMGNMSNFLSGKVAYNTLLLAKYELTANERKHWPKIAAKLSLRARIISIVEEEEVLEQWAINQMAPFTTIFDETTMTMKDAFLNCSPNREGYFMVVNQEGTVYLHISNEPNAMFQAHLLLGKSASPTTIGNRLAIAGWKKHSKITIYVRNVRTQKVVWESRRGLAPREFMLGQIEDKKEIEEYKAAQEERDEARREEARKNALITLKEEPYDDEPSW